MEGETFVYFSDLLGSGSPYLTPKVRAAALRALALVPGVHLVGAVLDAAGRPGTGIRGPMADDDVLVLDPATGNLLVSDNARYSEVTVSAVVRRIGQLPAP